MYYSISMPIKVSDLLSVTTEKVHLAHCRNRKCTERVNTFGRSRMSTESAHLPTFGDETETETEIRSTSTARSAITITIAPFRYSTVSLAALFHSRDQTARSL